MNYDLKCGGMTCSPRGTYLVSTWWSCLTLQTAGQSVQVDKTLRERVGEKNGWLNLRGDMREIRGGKGWERKTRNETAAVGKKNLGERIFFN